MNFESIKFQAKTEAESNLVQKCLFALGYKWADTQDQVQMKWSCVCWYSAFEDGDICRDDHDVNHHHRLVTLQELNDLVVFHRNDINDANCTYHPSGTTEILEGYLSTNGWYYLFTGGIWQKHVSEHHEAAKRFQPKVIPLIEHTIKVKGLEDLIEGPVALQAALNGQTVQFSFEPWEEKQWDTYNPQLDEVSAKVFFTGMSKDMRKVFFRMKPKTISINGIEVPSPYEPKVGDTVFFISAVDGKGWDFRLYDGSSVHNSLIQFGAWCTQTGIIKVVKALRKVFEVQS